MLDQEVFDLCSGEDSGCLFEILDCNDPDYVLDFSSVTGSVETVNFEYLPDYQYCVSGIVPRSECSSYFANLGSSFSLDVSSDAAGNIISTSQNFDHSNMEYCVDL